MVFGAIIVLAGLIGSLWGGRLSDKLLQRNANAYLWLPGITSLVAVPVVYLGLTSLERWVFLPCFLVAGILIFSSSGPINALLVNLVPADMRARAIAFSTVCIHLFGDAWSPTLIGFISTETGNLGQALLVAPGALGLAGVVWLLTAWSEELRQNVTSSNPPSTSSPTPSPA